MKEKEAPIVSCVRLSTVTTVDETWKKATDAIRQAASSALGTTKPGRRKIEKQTWLWTEVVKAKNAKKASKKAVAVAKATHYGDVYRKLESRDGERYLYRLAKTRHRQTEDIEKFFGINDEDCHLLTDRKKALKRWRDYFEKISTMEVLHPAISSVASVHGSVHKMTVEGTEALKKIKRGKATGPDDLTADF
ncbi:unnamed protein product [Heligmosomoides polygyrus]|uniref:Uncharacterized protein n=1 Tax=Heligmosomoides polygyrus TaxID=6339 RepID=A0A183FZY9_HELPZ|nr:unnamed protein product [Heligmosomoides polygyrus]